MVSRGCILVGAGDESLQDENKSNKGKLSCCRVKIYSRGHDPFRPLFHSPAFQPQQTSIVEHQKAWTHQPQT